MPQEESLILQVHSVRDDLASKRLDGLYWIDTRDMLADGLNKGGLDRTALQKAMKECTWKLVHEFASTGSSKVAKPSTSSTEQRLDPDADC